MYQFQRLDKKLTEWGFPIIESNTDFRVIKNVDFNRAYKDGKIEFRNDGIYLTHEGREWKGYMHLAESYFSRYSRHPKFHLTKCKTIQEFIDKNIFAEHYIFANSNTVNLIDDKTGVKYEDVTLRFCENCRKMIHSWISTTEDFFNSLDKSKIETEKIVETDIDIFGYDKNWSYISKAYRKNIDYTCESCSIKLQSNFDKRYWHVHHKDRDKLNNLKSNLQCLCILCHSYKDLAHEENFNKTRMKRELDSFVEKYKTELKSINNPYLNIYQNERK
jgi:hypothetical protein